MRSIPQGVAASSAQDDDIIDLGALFSALWRGKFIVILAVVVAIFLGGVYAYFVATPKYRSTAVVMLNNREEQVVDLGNVLGGLGSDRSARSKTRVACLRYCTA